MKETPKDNTVTIRTHKLTTIHINLFNLNELKNRINLKFSFHISIVTQYPMESKS
jgi:hypothetical protein